MKKLLFPLSIGVSSLSVAFLYVGILRLSPHLDNDLLSLIGLLGFIGGLCMMRSFIKDLSC
jgi:hypothetical protein